jgi:hypothetical protein
MIMFPSAGSIIYRNEAGEPIGWDAPGDPHNDPHNDPYDPDDYLAQDDEGDEEDDEDGTAAAVDAGHTGHPPTWPNYIDNRECWYVLTSRTETPNWRDRLSCGNPLPCSDHPEVR